MKNWAYLPLCLFLSACFIKLDETEIEVDGTRYEVLQFGQCLAGEDTTDCEQRILQAGATHYDVVVNGQRYSCASTIESCADAVRAALREQARGESDDSGGGGGGGGYGGGY